tara:strand:- start:1127 stop:1363 length:237 start_codon:yes stop_codon:yes gene_type:complete
MKPGDLVRVYTIANTHVERGAYGIIVSRSTYDKQWLVVYVMSEDRLYTFHSEQLRLLEENEEPSGIDIHKSYQFFDKD